MTSLERVPFHVDLLDGDLDQHLPNFGEGRPISWGLVVGAVAGGWDEFARLRGVDWEIRLHTPGQMKVPGQRRPRSMRTTRRTVPGHCALLMVQTGAATINGARDVGRSTVRSLLALVRREMPSLLPSDVLWEGGIAHMPRGHLRMTMSSMEMRTKDVIHPARIHGVGLKMASISVLSMPHHVRRALEWLALARSASVRAEKFIHLWLGVRAIADYGQPNKGHQMTRVERYTATMASGVGGVLSPARIQALNRRLAGAYSVRTDLLHRDDDSKITTTLLEDLEAAAFELVDFELAKVGVSMSYDGC